MRIALGLLSAAAPGTPCSYGPTCAPGELCSDIMIGGVTQADGTCGPLSITLPPPSAPLTPIPADPLSGCTSIPAGTLTASQILALTMKAQQTASPTQQACRTYLANLPASDGTVSGSTATTAIGGIPVWAIVGGAALLIGAYLFSRGGL